ncbi:MAG: FAD-dependent oxidoreductase, partial [Verrucomicrobia bacterium]|nr:FAD-dependent oxidoreductase [Verrucomicrobiota bacterium]
MSSTPRLSRRRFLSSAGAAGAAVVLSPAASFAQSTTVTRARSTGRELRADVLVVAASLGGVAAALAAARMGRTVLLTEETDWIGGQATTQ